MEKALLHRRWVLCDKMLQDVTGPCVTLTVLPTASCCRRWSSPSASMFVACRWLQRWALIQKQDSNTGGFGAVLHGNTVRFTAWVTATQLGRLSDGSHITCRKVRKMDRGLLCCTWSHTVAPLNHTQHSIWSSITSRWRLFQVPDVQY